MQYNTSGGVLGRRGQKLDALQPFRHSGAAPWLPIRIDSSPGVLWAIDVASPVIPLALDHHRTTQMHRRREKRF